MARESVKVLNGALDEVGGVIILRGVIDLSSLSLLKTGEYQREILPISKINDLIQAMRDGSVLPDVELGMRGENYIVREEIHYLQDDVYIVDGLQRITSAIQAGRHPEPVYPRIGAAIHFNTTEEWERNRFKVLNLDRVKVSPNVIIRNMHDEHPSVEALYNLSSDKSFVLGNRICWLQRMKREDVITARTFLMVAGTLHQRFGPGRNKQIEHMIPGLDAIIERVGRNTFRDNVRTFFDLIDASWGIRNIVFSASATHIKQTFLLVLAEILATHEQFWRERRLFIEKDISRKIAQFPLTDPEVIRLAGSGGQAGAILKQLMVDHIDRGRRTGRLRPAKVNSRGREVLATE